jgi:DNA adenine methylase
MSLSRSLKRLFSLRIVPAPLPQQVSQYPPTRYMGSKNKLLAEIWAVASQFDFETAIDLFSGSGVVSYMMKSHDKTVVSNDYMTMATAFAKAMIENNRETLSREEAEALLQVRAPLNDFVQSTFKGLYFSDQDNRQIDILRANIKAMRNPTSGLSPCLP